MSDNTERESPPLPDLLGAKKDRQSITADWVPLLEPIEGVRVKEMRNVVKTGGDVLCEIFRKDWWLDENPVDQVFQVSMNPGAISGWHAHRFTTDRLFVSQGQILIVLYDSREGSRTYGRVNEITYSDVRPTLISIPPGVWHAVRNVSNVPSVLLNLPDRAYSYEDPDHWRLPLDTDQIPYRFQGWPR